MNQFHISHMNYLMTKFFCYEGSLLPPVGRQSKRSTLSSFVASHAHPINQTHAASSSRGQAGSMVVAWRFYDGWLNGKVQWSASQHIVGAWTRMIDKVEAELMTISRFGYTSFILRILKKVHEHKSCTIFGGFQIKQMWTNTLRL